MSESFQPTVVQNGYVGWQSFYERAFEALADGKGKINQQRAVDAWKMLLTGPHSYVHMEVWCMYLETSHYGKPINQETWNSFARFTEEVQPDFVFFGNTATQSHSLRNRWSDGD